MRTYGTPSFLSSNSSRMEVSADAETGTDKQLRIQPFLCVSYDKEEDFYQPLRLVNTVFVGPVLMAAASQVESTLLKVVTGTAGLFIMVSNGVRYYEAYEEMERYRAELDKEK